MEVLWAEDTIIAYEIFAAAGPVQLTVIESIIKTTLYQREFEESMRAEA